MLTIMKMANKNIISIALTVLLVLSLTYTLVVTQRYEEMQVSLYSKIYDLKTDLEYFERLVNFTENRDSRTNNRGYIVSKWILNYHHENWTSPVPHTSYGNFWAVIYVPEDNMSIQLETIQILPLAEKFEYPLTIQEGNAFEFEETRIPGDQSDTYELNVTYRISPIAWTQNVTGSKVYTVEIEEAGFYTICITGEIIENSFRFSLRNYLENTATEAKVMVFITIRGDETSTPFGIL